MQSPSDSSSDPRVQVFRAEWDDEGVFLYQAFKHEIADWAVEHQTLGGECFNPDRMTWIKPSFAWVLYRSGYATKFNQERILKIKIGHDDLADLLSKCACGDGHGGCLGRVQWDPERDIMMPGKKGKEPRKMCRRRAIQIGLSQKLSRRYVESIISIEDVTELAHRVRDAHSVLAKHSKSDVMEPLCRYLPEERPYMPRMSKRDLSNLALIPGKQADEHYQIGRGKVKR